MFFYVECCGNNGEIWSGELIYGSFGVSEHLLFISNNFERNVDAPSICAGESIERTEIPSSIGGYDSCSGLDAAAHAAVFTLR